ncbi:MAG: hypothetical protein HQ485_15965, partial [Acidobacteria bacterium]|nr:hypothetical protein [Acidobacteriota bacterium]
MFQVSKKLRNRVLFAAGLAVALAPFAGDVTAQQAPADTNTQTLLHRPTDPRLQGFSWRSIGPTGQGGRIDALAVDEKNVST